VFVGIAGTRQDDGEWMRVGFGERPQGNLTADGKTHRVFFRHSGTNCEALPVSEFPEKVIGK
jgi:hypothetical protein